MLSLFLRTAPRASARSWLRPFSTNAKTDEVPFIDLQPFLHGSAADKQRVAKQIGEACERIGFFMIGNHGVPQTVIDKCWNSTRTFFDGPLRDKNVPMTEDYPYGYSGYKEEVLSKGLKMETPPDMKESFSIGPYNPQSGMPTPRFPPNSEVFQPDWWAYYRGLENLSGSLLRAFALALELPENWFDDKIDKHRCALRLLNYPAPDHPASEGQLRAGAHSDYGSLTILLQENVAGGGLQVLGKDGEWKNIVTPPYTFVINLGDLMARWTNDKWVSTLHRVVPPPAGVTASRRQSMAFFHNINHDHLVECISTCVTPQRPAKYPPKPAWEILMEKHLASTKSGYK
eukprot:GILJ01000661.1.p1 GENE.GILJ01000661.1~~GILJ01000661.1.p1  ORF type:complete len:360 (-),score=46.25 GILJ01000661.1:164-1195(-)